MIGKFVFTLSVMAAPCHLSQRGEADNRLAQRESCHRKVTERVLCIMIIRRGRSVTVPHSKYSPFRTLNIHRSEHQIFTVLFMGFGFISSKRSMIIPIYEICYTLNFCTSSSVKWTAL